MNQTSLANNSIRFYFLIFAVSGFAGLIYESIWTHYLKLFLGHAAYAQTLVLVIFMGGMAIGAAGAGRYSHRMRNLLLAYAIVEALIGAAAIFFHPFYVAFLDYAYYDAIPKLASSDAVTMFKWSFAALVILPQSILLGMTFPLMSAGIIRRFPATPGHSLAMLYFTNSFGAAIGILASGFVLINYLGLPGTIQLAGSINLILAGIVWWLCRRDHVQPTRHDTQQTVSNLKTGPSRLLYTVFIFCAGITGSASFLYEIGWIRMLSLVLGSTTHAFELMLSAFILGLALGGFLIRRRIDALGHVVKTLGFIQIVMGICAVATLWLYGNTFQLMQFAVNNLDKTDSGYWLFNLFSHGIALLIMLPATVCAGMTLPLLTYHLINKGYGERAIGGIYASNTIGAIIGVVLAVQWIMPNFGLKSVIITGAFFDVLLGLALLWYARPALHRLRWNTVTLSALFILTATALGLQLDPIKMASGVYISGEIKGEREMLYHRDGKTATISLFRNKDYTVIATNGKTEAAMSSLEVSKDEPTMTLSAHLPLALHPNAESVATIGVGSGLTSHSLLNSDTLKRVDTIEIEPAMVEAARGFGSRVSNIFNDRRSHIHIEDAKAFFTSQGKRYDIIISEPSNPWVSGVSGLFSKEFYQLVRNHLHDDGLLVQWIHLYHMDEQLVASIVKALSTQFEDYAIYALNLSDIAIIASKQKSIPKPDARLFKQPRVKADLARIGVRTVDDLSIRLLGTKRTLDPLFQSYPVVSNSDYYPFLDQNAVRARYLEKSATDLMQLSLSPAWMQNRISGHFGSVQTSRISENHFLPTAWYARQAQAVRGYLNGQHKVSTALSKRTRGTLQRVMNPSNACSDETDPQKWMRGVHALADITLPFLNTEEMQHLWQRLENTSCYARLSSEGQNWIRLYQAIGAHDAKQIINNVQQLLPTGSISASLGNDYLLAAGMLAHFEQDNMPDALALWKRYESPDNPGLMLRWVSSYIQSSK